MKEPGLKPGIATRITPKEESEVFSSSSPMIEFFEKPIWVDTDPFIGRSYAPVFMVKGGVEYFVVNRVVCGSHDEAEKLEKIKAMLLDTGGSYFKFYGIYDNPMNLLAGVKERKHTFSNPKTLFCDCRNEPRYGAGFIDFSGSCREASLTFSYRIYDPNLAAALRKSARSIIVRSCS